MNARNRARTTLCLPGAFALVLAAMPAGAQPRTQTASGTPPATTAATPPPGGTAATPGATPAAQTTTPPPAEQIITADDRAASQALFDQAVAADAQHNYSDAANLFETAFRRAPSPQALGAAIQEHEHFRTDPEHQAREASLALRMISEYASNPRMVGFGTGVVTRLAAVLTHVRVTCAGDPNCRVEIDNRLTLGPEFFVVPGAHHLAASWSQNRTVPHDFTGTAGGTEATTLTAPEIVVAVDHSHDHDHDHEQAPPPPPPPPPAPRPILPVAAPIITGVLTLACAAGLGASAGIMYGGVGAYNAMPTQAGLDAGRASESATDAFVILTPVFGAATIVTALLATVVTRPSSGERHVYMAPAVQTAAGTIPGLTLQGRF